jgi:hypothetical protein
VASLRFVVYDEDVFGDPNPIAVGVFPFGSPQNSGIRTGMDGSPCCVCRS